MDSLAFGALIGIAGAVIGVVGSAASAARQSRIDRNAQHSDAWRSDVEARLRRLEARRR